MNSLPQIIIDEINEPLLPVDETAHPTVRAQQRKYMDTIQIIQLLLLLSLTIFLIITKLFIAPI